MRFLFLFLRITEQKDRQDSEGFRACCESICRLLCGCFGSGVDLCSASHQNFSVRSRTGDRLCRRSLSSYRRRFYWGIGCLFLLYGLYRGIERPVMSLILTVLSLFGTRVALAYLFAPNTAVRVLSAIWSAIPVGWILADLAGFLSPKRIRNRLGAQHD